MVPVPKKLIDELRKIVERDVMSWLPQRQKIEWYIANNSEYKYDDLENCYFYPYKKGQNFIHIRRTA